MALIFTPHVVWQAANAWPTLEFIRNASAFKMLDNPPLQFFTDQLLLMNPLTSPLWIAGLVFFLRDRERRGLRIFGVIFVTVATILVFNETSRSTYLGPAYTMLFAGGAVAAEGVLAGTRRAWPRGVVLAILFTAGIILTPMMLPILPVETYIRYSRALGVAPATAERHELAQLPQHYADMFGWEELVESVADAFATLSPEEQEVAGVLVHNYGEAGAIDLLGRAAGLPLAISGHNNYWLWGPRGYSGEVMIIVGGTEESYATMFYSVTRVGQTDCGYCMPYENNQSVFVARGPIVPIDEIWPALKHFN